MSNSFVLRDRERGHDLIRSDGSRASYIASHPDGFVTRASSFNFHDYQSGRPGFGPIRVFGDEVFHGAGCGYNMHPHHNFVICAFILQASLPISIPLEAAWSISSGKATTMCSRPDPAASTALSISPEDMNAIYLWLMPDQLYLAPTYHRTHFDQRTRRNRIEQLVGEGDGALPIPQDIRVSRLVTDAGKAFTHKLRSPSHGVYVFVLEGGLTVDGTSLGRRDSFGVWGVDQIDISTTADASDVWLIETLMIDDHKIRAWEPGTVITSRPTPPSTESFQDADHECALSRRPAQQADQGGPGRKTDRRSHSNGRWREYLGWTRLCSRSFQRGRRGRLVDRRWHGRQIRLGRWEIPCACHDSRRLHEHDAQGGSPRLGDGCHP